MTKYIFLSYSGRDFVFKEQFTYDPIFMRIIGPDAQLFDYDVKASLGDIVPYLENDITGSAAVVAFISKSYVVDSRYSIPEFWKGLSEHVQRRLVFVPVLIDADAHEWWRGQKKLGALRDLTPDGGDYAFVDFTDDRGKALSIIGPTGIPTEAAHRVQDLATRIKRKLEEITSWSLEEQEFTATTPARGTEKASHRAASSEELSESRRYYVSYAWADQADPRREKDVDRLCEDARKRGVEVLRDKTTLRPGDLISSFMSRMGEADRVFIFLSDKYLKSPYCMFELFEMWRNSRENKEEFLRRVRVVAIDGTRIESPRDWLGYAKFWKQQRESLRQAIDELGWEDAGQEAQKRYGYIKTFTSEVSDVLALLADVVQPRTFEEFLAYGFEGREEPMSKS